MEKKTHFGCYCFPSGLLTACLALGVGGVLHGQVRPDARPNILWISAEDLSPDLGCYGDSYAKTPNLDRLASEGVRFQWAFSTAPVCAPSRSAIITGMYATSLGSMHMRSKAVPPPYVHAFPEYLRAAGYYCVNRSKTDYNFEAPPNHTPPPTIWDESSPRAHWRNRAPGQPFFAVINLTVTHESRIRTDEEAFAKDTARLTPDQRHDPALATIPPYYPDTPLVRKDWARYYDLVTAMDFQVAEILAELEADGLAGNTVVFFWGDHGRGLPRAKRWVYESGTRVPLMVRWPGTLVPGSVREDLASLVDLGPTVLAIAGVPVPEHFQGRVIVGPGTEPPPPFLAAHRDRMDETYDTIRALRYPRFRYIRNFFPGRPYAQHIGYGEEMPTMKEMRRRYKTHRDALSPEYDHALNPVQLLFFQPEKPVEELYDSEADPHEVRNLAGLPEYKEMLAGMRRDLAEWQKKTGDLGLVPEDELKERMRPGGVWVRTEKPSIEVQGADENSVTVVLSATTPGASIAWTTEEGNTPHWKLYSGAVKLPRPAVLRAIACRLGYLDSEEIRQEWR